MAGVEVRGIGKAFGGTRVLHDVTASFAAGGLTSLLGPSGSGKTTLLRIVAGFVAPDRGRVLFGGADVTDEPVWRRNIGMVFQSYALFPHMTVRQNIAFGLSQRGVRGAAAAREVDRVIELVRLGGFGGRRPRELSGGQQQRVALARAIVIRPRVLLLDEPLSALDRRLRQGMQIELRRIQRDSGLTTIFVTHDQEEALTLSDEIAILDAGRIVQRGTPVEVYERPRNRFAATFLGEMNLFTGTVRDGAVETGTARLRTADALPPSGTSVTLAVRPEKLRVAAPGEATDGAENEIAAVLRETIYAGASSTLLLATEDGDEIRLVTRRADLHATPGTRLRLAWRAADTVLLEPT